MANPRYVTLRSVTSSTGSGASAAFHVDSDITDPRANRTAGRFTLNVMSVSAGSLSVSIETSPDNTNFRHVDYFPPVNQAGGSVDQAFAKLDSYVRVRWVLEAGASAVFGVTGLAHQLYFPPEAINSIAFPEKVNIDHEREAPPNVVADCSIVGTGCVETALLNAGVSSPVAVVGERLRQCGVIITAFWVLHWLGIPREELAEEKERAEEYLDAVSKGEIDPDVEEPGEEEPAETTGFAVASDPPRGW
jgi:hypothetical protein